MRFALAFLAIAGLAAASCPNQCSGHGRCNEIDRCECFRSTTSRTGQRETWTGPDCSQRVCPYGTAHDIISTQTQEIVSPIGEVFKSRTSPDTTPSGVFKAFMTNGLQVPYDYNVDVEIIDWTHANLQGQFRYRRDVDKTWSTPVDFDLDNSVTNTINSMDTAVELKSKVNGLSKKTGVHVYFLASAVTGTSQTLKVGDRFFFNATYNEGHRYTAGDDNTAHPTVECSGRGNCDRSTGQCGCYNGYSGSACERTACINDCSGHGSCQSLKRFATDASKTYATAFDSSMEYGCKCDGGQRGADCSQVECPSGPDPMLGLGGANGRDCSGRGVCDFSTGICKCSPGYHGERCESRTTFV